MLGTTHKVDFLDITLVELCGSTHVLDDGNRDIEQTRASDRRCCPSLGKVFEGVLDASVLESPAYEGVYLRSKLIAKALIVEIRKIRDVTSLNALA
jgi:hypothetical protein